MHLIFFYYICARSTLEVLVLLFKATSDRKNDAVVES